MMFSVLRHSRLVLFCIALCSTFTIGQAYGQFTTVLNIPPDPNIGDFQSIGSDTQLNLADGGVIGYAFGAGAFSGTSNIEVNIAGGTVGDVFGVRSGAVANISSGLIGGGFHITDGGVVNISGGSFGDFFDAVDGSMVNISGGSFGDDFSARAGSSVHLFGGEFRLGGVLVTGLESIGNMRSYTASPVLSGTLADGTPIILANVEADEIVNGTLTLVAAALPPVGPALITAPSDPVPQGLRSGQTLIVNNGGVVGTNFSTIEGSAVEVSGGQVGNNFEAAGAQVTISSGSVGDNFDAFVGTTVNMTGGFVGEKFTAHFGSTINIAGGTIDRGFFILGSTVNVSGGSFGDDFHALSDRPFLSSSVTLSGGDFRLNGVLIEGLETAGNTLPLNIPDDSVLTGTLADGTPFAFTRMDNDTLVGPSGDFFSPGDLTLKAATLPAIGTALIIAPSDPVPLGIRGGQTLVVEENGIVGNNFNAGLGSTIEVTGGQVGENLEAVGTQVTIEGGSIGGRFDAYHGSMVNVSGGSVGDNFDAFHDSTIRISGGSVGDEFDAFHDVTVNITDGSVGDGFDARDNSTVNISGGTVGNGFDARDNSTVNISGGSVGNGFHARDNSTVNISGGSVGFAFDVSFGSTVNIFGGSMTEGLDVDGTVNISGGTVGDHFVAQNSSTVSISGGSVGDAFHAMGFSTVNLFGIQFILDGLDITASLATNTPFTVTDRDVTLDGLLADGTPFSFDLNSSSVFSEDFFDPDALLTVALTGPGDFNGDGEVSGTDFLKWQRGESLDPWSSADLAAWEANYGVLPGDFNGNGEVDGADFLAWQRGESPYPVSAGDLVAWEANYPAGGAPLSSTAAAVPEPTSLLLFATAYLALSVRSNRTGATVWLAQQ